MAQHRNRRQPDSVDVSLERGQVTTLVVASVLALGAVFLLGVGFGRRLAEPEAAPAVAREADAREGGNGAVEAPALTFHDALTSRRVEVDRPDVAVPKPQPVAAEKRVEVAAAPVPEEKAAAAPPAPAPVTKPARVEKAEAPAPKAAPAPPPAGGGWAIQVASSRERADTERLAGRLRDAGWDARVVPADIPGRGRWYRVRVGSYGSREDAGAAQVRLADAMDLSGLVVPE